MFIDTHCHPYSAKEKNIDIILKNFQNAGGTHLISIGTNINTSQKSIHLASENNFIYATVGIHPCDVLETKNSLEEDMNLLENYIINHKDLVVGIGETGLDYHWVSDDPIILAQQKEKQQKYFSAQLKLAEKYNLPVIIHNRNSADDILKILEKSLFQNFIIHCFSEDISFAEKCFKISKNAKMSFSGIVTFKNASAIQQTAQVIPLKNILVETDSPYLTPVPFRGKQENEPAFTQLVLEKIIELRKESAQEIQEQIYKNSLDIFKIKP
ncbi:MAG: TatD family hydrolase [Candidatus Gracilibacteria bacterium]|nr:TatD family hydrolase [Candidatus Gracilibacteria bacterium]